MAISLAFPFNGDLGLLLLALFTPHLLYLFTWTCTGAFTRVAKNVGVEAFTLFYKVKREGRGGRGMGVEEGLAAALDRTTGTISHAAHFPLYPFSLL